MSAALKIATVASGLTLFSAGALYTLRTPQQDFSKNALALEHTGEKSPIAPLKPKLYVQAQQLVDSLTVC
jgi:hypothetical protein